MLQVIKSNSCGISAIFFQCCFMIETQELMTVFDFSWNFSRNHFLEGGFNFKWGGGVLLLRWGASFLSGVGVGGVGCPMGGIHLDGGGSKKS